MLQKLYEMGRLRPEDRRAAGTSTTKTAKPRPIPKSKRSSSRRRKRPASSAAPITDEEIIERCIYVMVNEGAHILEEGIASRASDIDAIYFSGYGFPAYRGGPMWYANTVGLKKVSDRIEDFGWQPAPLLKRLASEDGKFE